jgi:hypothetical protein
MMNGIARFELWELGDQLGFICKVNPRIMSLLIGNDLGTEPQQKVQKNQIRPLRPRSGKLTYGLFDARHLEQLF